MTKRRIIVALCIVAAVLGAGGYYVANKVHIVDIKPGIAFGQGFYNRLESGDTDQPSAMYSTEMRQQPQWQNSGGKLLPGLQSRFGVVKAVSLTEARVIPNNEVACVLLRYSVERSGLASDEQLIVCPDSNPAHFVIAGHRLTRLDTKQTISFGITVDEASVHFP